MKMEPVVKSIVVYCIQEPDCFDKSNFMCPVFYQNWLSKVKNVPVFVAADVFPEFLTLTVSDGPLPDGLAITLHNRMHSNRREEAILFSLGEDRMQFVYAAMSRFLFDFAPERGMDKTVYATFS